MAYEQEKQVAIAAVLKAALLCEKVRSDRNPPTIKKPDGSPVTIADLGAQAIICPAIAAAFPTDVIVGEEDAFLLRQPTMVERLQQVTKIVKEIEPDATDKSILSWIDLGNGKVSSRYWTLDPIDGTKGYIRGDGYAIALALIENGTVKLGVMACPGLPIDINQPDGEKGVLFVAVSEQGTTMTALKSGSSQPIRAENNRYLRLTESVESRHGNLPLQRAIASTVGLNLPPLQLDSLAKYGAIARGDAALYLRLIWADYPDYRENVWDHAAGAIVLEEAGGRVTDIDGKPLDFGAGAKLINNRGIVASNGVLHEAVLEALRKQ